MKGHRMSEDEREERMTKVELYALTFLVVSVLALVVVFLDVNYWRP
jgi:hypothetical protein